MRKHKKLALKSEAIRTLTVREFGEIDGGITPVSRVISDCYPDIPPRVYGTAR